MAGNIFFDNILNFYAPRSTFPTLAMQYVVNHAEDHPDIRWLASDWKKQCGLKMWSLRNFSLDGLRVVQRALARLETEFTAVLDQWTIPADWRPMFLKHLNDLQAMLMVRIERVERHGTTQTDLPAMLFNETLYWEAAHREIDAVLDFVRREAGDSPAFHDVFVARQWLIESGANARRLASVPAEGLLQMLCLLDEFERAIGEALPQWSEADCEALVARLAKLRDVINRRLAELAADS